MAGTTVHEEENDSFCLWRVMRNFRCKWATERRRLRELKNPSCPNIPVKASPVKPPPTVG